MQIESYHLSNLPTELVKEIIPYIKTYRAYTALACCTKKFNEIAKQYSIISWPIKITILNEFNHVSHALHHLGCDILAITQLLKIEVKVDGEDKKVSGVYGVHGSIHELESGKFIAMHSVGHDDSRNLECGYDFPYKSSQYSEETSYPFVTDTCYRSLPYRLTDEKRNFDIENNYGVITIKSAEKETINFQCDSSYIYSENKGYFIYEKGSGLSEDPENMLIVHDVDSNKHKLLYRLKKNEFIHKYIYSETADHLVFSSGSKFGDAKFTIYDVSTGTLLKRFSMNRFLDNISLILYLPEKNLIIINHINTLLIFDLISEKILRRITLKHEFPIEQLSFKNNSLYITQNDSRCCGMETPNCIISKIDFYKS